MFLCFIFGEVFFFLFIYVVSVMSSHAVATREVRHLDFTGGGAAAAGEGGCTAVVAAVAAAWKDHRGRDCSGRGEGEAAACTRWAGHRRHQVGEASLVSGVHHRASASAGGSAVVLVLVVAVLVAVLGRRAAAALVAAAVPGRRQQQAPRAR